MVALNFSQSLEQMKQATAAIENTSGYVRSEIERKKAIHNKDVTDLIRHEHNAYYQKALDSFLAYDDLALHGERDLERVCERFTFSPSSHWRWFSSQLQPSEEQAFPGCKHYSSPTCEP